MTKPESKFWKLIKPHLPGDVSRIENTADEGTPDVSGVYGLDYWVELKVSTLTTKQADMFKILRPAQIAWHTRRASKGSKVFVVIKYSDFITLHICSDNRIGYQQIGSYMKAGNAYNWPRFEADIKEWIHGLRNTETRW